MKRPGKAAPKPFTILTALDSPELFGKAFAGPSWSRWRTFLRALFALPMSPADLEVYREHTGRQTAPTGRSPLRVWQDSHPSGRASGSPMRVLKPGQNCPTASG